MEVCTRTSVPWASLPPLEDWESPCSDGTLDMCMEPSMFPQWDIYLFFLSCPKSALDGQGNPQNRFKECLEFVPCAYTPIFWRATGFCKRDYEGGKGTWQGPVSLWNMYYFSSSQTHWYHVDLWSLSKCCICGLAPWVLVLPLSKLILYLYLHRNIRVLLPVQTSKFIRGFGGATHSIVHLL